MKDSEKIVRGSGAQIPISCLQISCSFHCYYPNQARPTDASQSYDTVRQCGRTTSAGHDMLAVGKRKSMKPESEDSDEEG